MHVAIALFVAFLVLFVMLLVVGATPILGIPLFLLLVAAPFGWIVLTKVLGERRHPTSDVPTSGQAAYDPVVRPED